MKVTFKLCHCRRFDSGLLIQETIHSWLSSSAIDARSALSLTSCESIFSSSIKLIGFLLFVVKNSFIGIIFEWIKNHSFFLFKQAETRIQLVLWNRWMEKNETLPFYCRKKFWRIVSKRRIAAFSGCRCDRKSWSNPSVLSVNEKFHTKPCLGSLSLKGLSTIRLIYNYESVAM